MTVLRSLLALSIALCAGLSAARERIRSTRLGREIHDTEQAILRLDARVRGQRVDIAGLESPQPLEQRALALGLSLETPKTWNIVNVSRPPQALARTVLPSPVAPRPGSPSLPTRSPRRAR